MKDELALLPGYLAAHLELTLVALGLGVLVSVPAGILITRRHALEAPLLGLASVIQTIPSLALLAVMVPALALASRWLEPALGISLPAIGALPALVALTLYATLPILRNTVVGIAGVDPAVIEAARGVGMSGREQLLRVELPLALPVVVAGVRTATVWVVGAATLSTPVGATSLGNFIFSGLQTRNFGAVWLGCVASAALALVLDGIVRVLETGLRERRRGLVGAAAAALAVLGAGAGLAWLTARGAAVDAVTVGSKTFTEQYVLSEILAGLVESSTQRRARAVQSLGSTVLFDALVQGEIDVYVDYSGTLWATLLRRSRLPDDRQGVRREVERWLAEEHGIRVAAALGFENTYALAVRGAQARELGLASIGDLAPLAPSLEIGGDYEFFVRPEWKAVQTAYGLRFRAQRSMDSSLMYEALARGEVDVISAFSTDGRIAALDLRVLADDRRAIPPYDALVLAGPRIAREAPDVLAALGRLEGAIDADAMRRMNAAVDRDGRAPGAVAREFLARLSRAARRGAGPGRTREGGLTQRSTLDFAPYLAPYATFLVLVTLGAPLALRVALPGALFGYFLVRGGYPELRGGRGLGRGALLDVLFGLGIAVLWVAPYLVFAALPRPGPGDGFDPTQPFGEAGRSLALAVRLAGFAGVTPFVEELFVRSFLIRYVDVFDRGGDFREVPIGRFAWRSFVVTSLYFALSHARWEWPVALATGVLFNLWLYRRRSLPALILAHAVANAAIWAAVVLAPAGLATPGGGPLDPWIFL